MKVVLHPQTETNPKDTLFVQFKGYYGDMDGSDTGEIELPGETLNDLDMLSKIEKAFDALVATYERDDYSETIPFWDELFLDEYIPYNAMLEDTLKVESYSIVYYDVDGNCFTVSLSDSGE
jgi:hypothetical protein